MNNWMIFCSEIDRVHYLWDGKNPPFLVHVPPLLGTEEAPYFWTDKNEHSLHIIKEAADGKKVRVFKITGHPQRYQIVAKGQFLTN